MLSIIVPTLNSEATIGRLLNSIQIQKIIDYEIIIVDGNSVDRTLEIAASYENVLIASYPPKGVYNAINKGIKLANGEWLYFIGSDDALQVGIWAKISHLFNTGDHLIIGGRVQAREKDKIYYPSLGILTLLFNTLHHQGAFYNKQLFRHLAYNESLDALADYEFNLLCFLRQVPIAKTEHVICIYSLDGISSRLTRQEIKREFNNARSSAFARLGLKSLAVLPNFIFSLYVNTKFVLFKSDHKW